MNQPKPLEVFMRAGAVKNEKVDNEKNKEEYIEGNIVKSLPKTSKNHIKFFLDYVKLHPKIISWNEKGELIYCGEQVQGSNVSDLALDLMNNQTNSSSPVFHSTIFTKALEDMNVLNKWVKNSAPTNGC